MHFWRVMGYLHGIEDQFNPFGPTLESGQHTLVQVVENVLLPSLESPPENFHLMVQVTNYE